MTADIGGNSNVIWIQHDASNASRYNIHAIQGPSRFMSFHASQPAELLSTIAAELFNGATFVALGYRSNWVLGFPDRIHSSLDSEVRKMVMAQVKPICVSSFTDISISEIAC
jgi:hypothetical protein